MNIMTKFFFAVPGGNQIEVEAANGETVKDVAVDNGVPGILAECGGQCVCGTCHAYVDERLYPQLVKPTELEQELLEGSMEERPNSRLTCQLVVDQSMEGMVFTVPERLY
jgi:2Fe-2S ferredoxin